jgi:hypothetical protein
MSALPHWKFVLQQYTALQYSSVNSHDPKSTCPDENWSVDKHEIVFFYDSHFTRCAMALSFPCFCTLEDSGHISSLFLLWCCGGGRGASGGGGAAAGMNPHFTKLFTETLIAMYLHFLSYHHVLVPGVHTWKSFQNSVYNNMHIYRHPLYAYECQVYIYSNFH